MPDFIERGELCKPEPDQPEKVFPAKQGQILVENYYTNHTHPSLVIGGVTFHILDHVDSASDDAEDNPVYETLESDYDYAHDYYSDIRHSRFRTNL